MANDVVLKLAIEGARAVRGEIENVDVSIGQLAKAGATAAKAMTGMFIGFAASQTIGKIISVQREFDVLKSSLVTVTGSSAAAAREMAWIKTFAKETPFGLAQATQGFVKMKALGLDPTLQSLTSFGNTASAMGKDLSQMVEAVADASTGEFERLKEFGIKASAQGSQVKLTFQGVTTTVGNSAKEITGYLEGLGNNQFAGAMALRAATLDGAIAGLTDTWDELFRTVSSKGAGSIIFDSVTVATRAIEDATTILNSMTSAASANAKEAGAMGTVQEALAKVFETVAVLGLNVKYVLTQVWMELRGLEAQAEQILSGNFAAAAAIHEKMVADSAAARREVDATTAAILSARDAVTTSASVNAQAQARIQRQGGEAAKTATQAHVTDLKAAAAEAQKQSEVLARLSGFTGNYADEVNRLSAMHKNGLLTQEAYNRAVNELVNSQPGVKAVLDQREKAAEDGLKAAEASAKVLASAAKAADAYRDANLKDLSVLEESNTKLAEHNQEIGLSAEALDLLRLRRLDDALATEEQVRSLMNLQNSSQEEIDMMERRIKLLKEQRNLTAAGQDGEAASKAAKSAADEWKRTSDSINQSLTDALMRGWESGKGFAENFRDTVVNMFKTLVLQPVISAIVSPVSMGVSSMMGLSGAANAAGGASGGAAAAVNGASMLSSMKGWMTDFGGSAASSAGSLGSWLSTSSNSTLQELGGAIGRNTAAIGNFATNAGYVYAAVSAIDAASRGKWGQAIGTGVGAIWGPLGSAIGGALGGWIDSAFGGGHEYTTGSGISGKFSNAGFSGRNYQSWRNDGSSGFFGIGGSGSSSGTNYSAMSRDATDSLGSGFASIQFAASAMAMSLGLDAKRVLGYSKDITLALSGDAEANKKAIADLFASIADEVAVAVAPSIGSLAKNGETASTTLAR